ncbi:hypothetical protein SPRG_12028 [Saprolegnia parasitica CBS 223.65]|uniref:Uncharacterized protein n=1 Tax=Saprolegnia parasitica (strain CBS 223.65) TaxID=695850 RepID=A0A067C8M1_SAPPC|nr:hypothetical protein SPRG_12028 [Saprolegnia parasitica CBS 223.65]KDO22891.1 hypothetical protein SPRG_12028 [Saprolegnia parasitica CBS 223.65]|eukprot:XP_012206446.1 hypothetical protein SPRG_12028 [Saprolegnia parasitica CBS 223.65]
MSSVVLPSTDDESEFALSVDRTENVQPSASTPPTKVVRDTTHKVYCQGGDCRKQWHQDALDPTTTTSVKNSTDVYSPSCFSQLEGNPSPSPVRWPWIMSSFKYPTRDASLDKYKAIMKDSREHLGLLCFVVIFWPLTGGYFYLKLRGKPLPEATYDLGLKDHLHWIMAAVSHLQCSCCCAYTWFILVAIIQSCKYGAQVWFWALLEVYTVYFLLLNIMYVAAPIITVKPVLDIKSNCPPVSSKAAPPTAVQQPLASRASPHDDNNALVLPVAGLGCVEYLLASLPNTYLIAKVGEDVEALVFTGADGQALPVDTAPSAFATRVNTIDPRVCLYRACLSITTVVVVGLNIWLMLSWVTHAWPSQDFGIPIDSLIQLPANVHYNVAGTMTDICQPNDDGTFRAVWNLALTPTPSIMNGLPTIELSFATRLLDPVYFTDLAVGTLRLVTQDTYSMTVRPAVNQQNVTIRASFGNVSSCDDIATLLVLHSTTYSQKSLQDRLEAAPRGLALLPTLLLVKYCFQMLVVAGIVGYSSLQILSLWLQFDALTKKVDLTLHQNLDVWHRLRHRVFKVVTFYTEFVTALMSIALAQLAVAFGGLVIYCLSGVAPLPGYYLLILTMVGSLSTLAFLLPLAKALDIQASHEAKLHALLLQLHHERERR